MIIKQLSVFLENKSGRLAEVTKILFEQNINISALSIAETADYGLLRMIVNDPEKAESCLKQNNIAVHITQVLAIVVPDSPGGLYRAVQILADNAISIEYLYAFSREEKATVVIRTDNIERTIKVLQENKINLLKSSDLYKI